MYFLGFTPLVVPVQMASGKKDLGILFMIPRPKNIKEVTVNGEVASAVQNGDTTVLNAKAFATNPDATAEDLMKKMPGITVDQSGTVTVQGETVKKVLVDGRKFFGDDPSIALRNLPASVIDKVQVFDKLSDQAELTGIDDGQSVKTLNIITRQSRRNGSFGKFFAGSSHDGKYLIGGNLNVFNHQRRISIIGLSNNVNQQNFSTQDLLGVLGVNNNRMGWGRGSMHQGGGAFFGGGALNNFLVGQQNGVSTTNSIGLNYSDSWGKKINVSGSFFANTSKNNTDQTQQTKYILTADSSENYDGTSHANTKNYNYRLAFRFEYTMSPMSSLIISPRINFQDNRAQSNLFQSTPTTANSTLNTAHTHGYNISNNITFRHRFKKRGRTFSADISNSDNQNDSKSTLWSQNNYIQASIPPDSTDQNIPETNNSNTLGTQAFYTEPVTKNSLIQLGYNLSYTWNNTDKETFNLVPPDAGIQDTSLSNEYNNTYTVQRAGIGYRIRSRKMNFALGADYQQAVLDGNETFPVSNHAGKVMDGFLPNLMFHYRFSRTHNFFLRYRASTNPPSIQQLQDVVNNSNPQLLSTGNPDLRQENSHTVITRYSFANPDKSINYFLFGYMNFTHNAIETSTIIPLKDTLIGGYRVKSGVQLSRPVNLNHSWNTRLLFMYSFPLNLIKTKVNLLGGGSFAQTPGYINQQLNRANSYNLNGGVVFASNISPKVDFTVSYTLNYNMARNTLQSQVNNSYWAHEYNAKLDLILWKGIVLRNELNGELYNGLTGIYNTRYNIWNIELGKKFLKKESGELKVSVFDLLNQNKNIARTVTSNSIQDSYTNTLRRYVMLTFTYTLRNFKGMTPPTRDFHDFRHWHGGGPLRD